MAERVIEICDCLKGNPRPVILEIGSHTGEDTARFLSSFPDASIYCFEPDPRCCLEWRGQITASNARMFEMAVGDSDGLIKLNLSECKLPKSRNPIKRLLRRWFSNQPAGNSLQSLGQSSIALSESESAEYPWLIFRNTVEVTSTRLDSWRRQYCSRLSLIDLIWSDVQGAERRMIDGAVETLSMTRFLTVEYGEVGVYKEAMTREETVSVMKKHNFCVVGELSDEGPKGNLLFQNLALRGC